MIRAVREISRVLGSGEGPFWKRGPRSCWRSQKFAGEVVRPGSWAQLPGRRGGVGSPRICRGPGVARAPKTRPGLRGQTTQSAGDRCTAFFRILLLEEQRAGARGRPVATAASPGTGVASRGTARAHASARAPPLSRLPRPHQGPPHRVPEGHAFPGRLLPQPAGPLPSVRPSAPKPGRVARGLARGGSPGRSRLRTLRFRRAANLAAEAWRPGLGSSGRCPTFPVQDSPDAPRSPREGN